MAILDELVTQIENPDLRARIAAEVAKLAKQKKFGLVFEEHLPECTPLWDIPVKKGSKVALKTGQVSDFYTVLKIEDGIATCLNKDKSAAEDFAVDELVSVAEFGEPIYPYLKPIDTVCNAPDSDLWHTLIEADNYHALQLLEYLYAGKVDCIYIDPPYNTGARDWKYNNDYVDNSDQYRHSKWLSMMQKRLRIAKKLLNPQDSVLIVTIDEKEYLHLGCLLEETFPGERMQMISCVINHGGVARASEFSRTDEYIYIVMLGNSAPQPLPLIDEWLGNVKNSTKNKLRWRELRRMGSHKTRAERPGLFYPIFVTNDGKSIFSVGEVYRGNNINEVIAPEGTRAIWPLFPDGKEGCWQLQPDTLREHISSGYVRLGGFTQVGMAISYIASGEQKKVEKGEFQIVGHREDGSIIVDESGYEAKYVPGSAWSISSHNATEFGTKYLTNLFRDKRFEFPKSLYAEHDTIRFFVADKPNALIVDFFAGSGTTLHAVNLLNAEDGGHRRCIIVTNNEISEVEKKEFEKRGVKQGSEEWESKGIARYVTWPRTVCSIEGHDVNGNPLKGNYLGSDLPMADGFKANAAFFKLGFLDKNAVALGRQFKEMLPTLWMKAGAHGPCPTIDEGMPDMLILPENKFAVLVDERQYMDFAEKLDAHPEIETVFIVTDSESGYRDMISGLDVKASYQLYRDYLDNFRINAARR